MGLPMHRIHLKDYRVPTDVIADDENESPDPLRACLRFADGVQTESDIAWVSRAFAAYLRDSGSIPLERCLHLPTTHAGWRRINRDIWLCKAARLVGHHGSWSESQRLAGEWERFISRGAWSSWRDEEAPPAYATDLSAALFYATRLNRSQGLNAKQIHRIVGHFSTEKSR